MSVTHFFHENLMKRRLPQIKGNDRNAGGDQGTQQLIGLLLAAYPNLVFVFFFCQELCPAGRNIRCRVLLGLQMQVDPAIAFLISFRLPCSTVRDRSRMVMSLQNSSTVAI